jgi:hypothetical protein
MSEDSEKETGKGFKVQDRRRFSSDGEEHQEATEKEDSPGNESEVNAAQSGEKKTAKTEKELLEINFSTFVISLSTQALMHLGEINDPVSGKAEKDVVVAKHMIDIIGMLQEKTRGNLDEGEQKLIEDILYSLRIRYVEAVREP